MYANVRFLLFRKKKTKQKQSETKTNTKKNNKQNKQIHAMRPYNQNFIQHRTPQWYTSTCRSIFLAICLVSLDYIGMIFYTANNCNVL